MTYRSLSGTEGMESGRMWKNTMMFGRAENFRTNWVKTIGTMSPTLSKNIPTPATEVMVDPPKRDVSWTSPVAVVLRSSDGWKRSVASDFHCDSLPKRQRTKIEERSA
jgi:hypothetical protein